ncbi:hypothetical protein D3C76_1126060 [compost metagenome]
MPQAASEALPEDYSLNHTSDAVAALRFWNIILAVTAVLLMQEPIQMMLRSHAIYGPKKVKELRLLQGF